MKLRPRGNASAGFAALVVTTALVGCGGGGGGGVDFNAANASAPPGTTQPSVSAFVDDLRQGGFECTPQRMQTWRHPQLSWSAKYQECKTPDNHSVTAYVFSTPSQRASFLGDLVPVAQGAVPPDAQGPELVLTATKLDSEGNVADEFGSGDTDLAASQEIVRGALFEVNAG